MMNTVQMKYARERAKNIFDSKKQELRTKHTVPKIKLDNAQIVKAFKEGKFTVNKVTEARERMYYLTDYISFNEERAEVFNDKAYNEEAKDLTEKYNKLTDEIILGDCEKALNLLKDFSNA